MKLVCVKEIEGFTVGKEYELLGYGEELVQLKDDNGQDFILLESYFDIVDE